MTNPTVFRSTLSIGVLGAAQMVLPPLVATAMLLVVTLAYSVQLTLPYTVLAALVFVLCVVLLQPARAPLPQLIGGRRQLAVRIGMRWLLILCLLLGLGFATKSSSIFSRRAILTWAAITPGLLIYVAVLLHEMLRQAFSDPANLRRAAFVGYNDISLALAERIERNAASALSVVGFFDDRTSERLGVATATAKLRGGLRDIVPFVKHNDVDVVFVALPVGHISRVKALLDDLRDTTVSIYYVPMVFPFDSIQGGTSEFLGLPLIALCETPFHGYRGVSKRVSDIVLATMILIPAAPVMLIIALLVRLTSRGPAVFKQRRYGLEGHEIIVYKFRTMTTMDDGDSIAQATRSDPRITPLGRLLRRSSLDELPQLINVLQGRMSLVGPRPHAVAHNELYRKLIKGYMVRHKVMPGITGLAQVHGLRGETQNVEQMEERLRYDLEYLRNWSPLLDLKILIKTFVIVLRGDRAY